MIRLLKIILGSSILFLLGMAFGYPLKAETIRMAWFPIPPHVFVAEDGVTPTGPTIELFNSIAMRMGCSVDWIGPLPLSRLTKYQTKYGGGIDGSIFCTKTPVLQPYVYYPQKAYFIAQPCLAVRTDNPLKKIETDKDIWGYRIGYVNLFGLGYPSFLQNNLKHITIQAVSGQDWTSRNLAKLCLNRIDAVFELNRYTLEYQAVVDKVDTKIRILNIPSKPLFHYYVFQKNAPNGKKLLDRYEEAVKGMNIDYIGMLKKEIDKRRK